MKMYNFNSGPSILPQEVLQQASEAVLNFNDIGLSILEIGHRSDWFAGYGRSEKPGKRIDAVR